MSNTLQQPVSELLKYKDINSFWRVNNLPARREKYTGQYWRLADMSVGHVNALPGLRGKACATDGVLLIVQNEQGQFFDCHLDSWKCGDEDNKFMGYLVASAIRAKRGGSSSASNSVRNRVKVSLEQLADLLT